MIELIIIAAVIVFGGAYLTVKSEVAAQKAKHHEMPQEVARVLYCPQEDSGE
jgi:hypothetical protein